jgi:hypothetical protein
LMYKTTKDHRVQNMHTLQSSTRTFRTEHWEYKLPYQTPASTLS